MLGKFYEEIAGVISQKLCETFVHMYQYCSQYFSNRVTLKYGETSSSPLCGFGSLRHWYLSKDVCRRLESVEDGDIQQCQQAWEPWRYTTDGSEQEEIKPRILQAHCVHTLHPQNLEKYLCWDKHSEVLGSCNKNAIANEQ